MGRAEGSAAGDDCASTRLWIGQLPESSTQMVQQLQVEQGASIGGSFDPSLVPKRTTRSFLTWSVRARIRELHITWNAVPSSAPSSEPTNAPTDTPAFHTF